MAKVFKEIKDEINDCQSGISTDGGRRVIVSGCCELLSYTEQTVRIATQSGILGICGDGLTLRAFHGNRMLVEGKWTQIVWEGKI